MKPFKFSLQPLHTLRLRKERQAMEDYAKVLLEQARAIEILKAAQSELATAQSEWQIRAAAGCSAFDMVHNQLHCRELAQKQSKSLSLVKEATQRAEAALQAMIIARQEREVVDKFYERQRAVYDRELSRAEHKFLDELAYRQIDIAHSPGANPN